MAKKPMIKYTSREFDSIRNDLIGHAKRYYPDSYKDFNGTSFGSLMLDTVAYVGDVLSFYLDYQANEQFLSTANEYNNVIKLAKQHGYRHSKVPTSTGFCTFFCLLPVASGGGPNEEYAPILKKGTEVSTAAGATFMLAEDVNFSDLSLETVIAKVGSGTGNPTSYARKAYGRVISGKPRTKSITVGDFRRFRRIGLSDDNVAEVIEVVDSEGHQYYEVEYLTQNVVYRAVTNSNSVTMKAAPFILKAFPAPRRFTVETEAKTTFLRFGYGSEADLATDKIVDPANLILDLYGKNYSTDDAIDPYRLLNNDKMGVSPANTVLRVRYRQNNPGLLNASAGSVSTVSRTVVEFGSLNATSISLKAGVRSSIEVENEEPIVGDVSTPGAEEIRVRALSMFASQNRAVTREDYMALSYSMDKRFGAIKRVNIVKDEDSFKNNLNMYVISEDEDGYLSETNSTIKANLKTWLSRYKMINDSIDILDARVVNFGIDFEFVCSLDFNKYDILESCLRKVKDFYSDMGSLQIGESITINDVYNTVMGVNGVVDVSTLSVSQLSTPAHEQTQFQFDAHRSPDGRYVIAPEDVIFELRYPELDIRGGVK